MTSYAAVQLRFYRHFWVMIDHRLYESMSYCLKKSKFHPEIFTETCKIMDADLGRDDWAERQDKYYK